MIKTGKIKVNVGDIISTIILSSTSNSKINLFEEAQKNNLILFFFPGYGIGKTYSELSGCTLEGKMFRDNNQAIKKLRCCWFLHKMSRALDSALIFSPSLA